MSRRKWKQTDVELNMASMLDMAFQLLTFFILTFRPPPVEGQIGLRLPPATVVVPGKDKIGEEDKKPVNPKGIHTLTISVFSDNGTIDSMGVGEQQTKTLHDLDVKLQQVFKDPNNPFDQVILQSSPKLRYGELMQVVEVCASQKFADGTKLKNLSFLELPGADSK